MAPLQKRAWYGLVIGVVWAIAIVVVFITKGGITAFPEDTGMRLLLDALFIGGLIVYLVMLFLTRPKKGQAQVTMDERDRVIMGRAPVVQLWAVIISLVVWMIALTEFYWDEGQIPVIFPSLIFFSTLIVSTVSQSVGILIGYWRMGRNG